MHLGVLKLALCRVEWGVTECSIQDLLDSMSLCEKYARAFEQDAELAATALDSTHWTKLAEVMRDVKAVKEVALQDQRTYWANLELVGTPSQGVSCSAAGPDMRDLLSAPQVMKEILEHADCLH
jgi:hypothetical protein